MEEQQICRPLNHTILRNLWKLGSTGTLGPKEVIQLKKLRCLRSLIGPDGIGEKLSCNTAFCYEDAKLFSVNTVNGTVQGIGAYDTNRFQAPSKI